MLRLGDMDAARRVFEAVAPLSGRGPGHFRMRWLNSYIRAAESDAR